VSMVSVSRRAGAEHRGHAGKTISPAGQFLRLYNLFDNLGHNLGRYVDMPYAELAAMALAAGAGQRSVLLRRLEDVADNVAGLRRAFEKAGKK